jgi:lysozyme family protein
MALRYCLTECDTKPITKGGRSMRNRGLQVLVAFFVFVFVVASVVPSFAAESISKVKAIQSALNKEGYKIAVDGKMGKQTHDALKKYQKANGLAVTGKADAPTTKKLGVK